MTNPATSPQESELRARTERAVAPSYELESELGRGGAGIVYRARDLRLKRSVAVKILPPDLAFRADVRDRFMREAETSARLSHPNIVPIYTVDEKEGIAFFVMALVSGENLAERVRMKGALPFAETRRILREVADALTYAHARGVVHRDIKPDNILIESPAGRALVTDFGIARAATESDTRLTATGQAIGTPAYMSPEQCAGERELDGRSDLYSLGAVTYYMLTGQPPFTGTNTPAVMMKHVTERPLPVRNLRPDVPADLERIVMRLLEKDPAARFADGAELTAALDGNMPPEVERQPERHRERKTSESAESWLLSAYPKKIELPGFPSLPMPPLAPLLKPPRAFFEEMEGRQAKWEAKSLQKEERRLRKEQREAARPMSDRIKSFRRHLVSYAASTTFLFGINALTGGGLDTTFWWAFFPAFGMMIGLANEGGSLWAAGARMKDVFGGGTPGDAPQQSAMPTLATAPVANTPAIREVHVDIPPGRQGDIARSAVEDRRAIHDLVGRMKKEEREMLPDVLGTADALFDRVVALATALARLDTEISPDRLEAIEERIARSEESPESSDRERLLRLLRRQRDMLADLLKSRATLSGQYESAGLLLQNLKFDLLKMRSSGLQSTLADVTSVTQEARALSSEIGYVLAAADELREIDGK